MEASTAVHLLLRARFAVQFAVFLCSHLRCRLLLGRLLLRWRRLPAGAASGRSGAAILFCLQPGSKSRVGLDLGLALLLRRWRGGHLQQLCLCLRVAVALPLVARVSIGRLLIALRFHVVAVGLRGVLLGQDLVEALFDELFDCILRVSELHARLRGRDDAYLLRGDVILHRLLEAAPHLFRTDGA